MKQATKRRSVDAPATAAPLRSSLANDARLVPALPTRTVSFSKLCPLKDKQTVSFQETIRKHNQICFCYKFVIGLYVCLYVFACFYMLFFVAYRLCIGFHIGV